MGIEDLTCGWMSKMLGLFWGPYMVLQGVFFSCNILDFAHCLVPIYSPNCNCVIDFVTSTKMSLKSFEQRFSKAEATALKAHCKTHHPPAPIFQRSQSDEAGNKVCAIMAPPERLRSGMLECFSFSLNARKDKSKEKKTIRILHR